MNLSMGSHTFRNVQIPLLWGTRAVLQDRQRMLSVIDLSGKEALPEIIEDEPASGIEFLPRIDGFVVLRDGEQLYSYNPKKKLLTPIALRLPSCEITPNATRIGTNEFSGGVISGYAVGIEVTEQGMSMGAPMPPQLAKLVI